VHLRHVRHEALTLLWRLTRTPERRRALLPRLDPHDLPSGVAADLGAPDPAELAVLSARLDPHDPAASLCTIAAHGEATDPGVLADLLLRVAGDVASAREPDSGPRSEGAHPAEEPTVPQKVVDALCDLGRRLHARGRIRPVGLLDAPDAPAAGRAFTASLALDLVERPDLADGELVALLELLLRVPFPGTRARVHRLLRHRDPHVRKHAIALVAQDGQGGGDGTGEGARALSASLVALTTAPDIQTVRQAVLALGRARARWACAAIAACLDHPNMNIRKTAARALTEAGTPEAVPSLLRCLARSDNPGLRAELGRALRAVLGDARTATLLAAAEYETGPPRTRLLDGLDGDLPVRTCAALAEQASPVARDLLALVASGRVRLADGVLEDLAEAMSAYGIAPVAVERRERAGGAADADAEALLSRGWDPAVALRLAARPEPPGADRLGRLRARLADWLRLAETGPTARVLRLTLLACPAPRSADERRILARHATTLIDGLADLATASGDPHAAPMEPSPEPGGPEAALVDDLVEALVEAASALAADEAFAAAERLRALPLGAVDGRRALRLLRVLGALPVRSDLDRALATARSSPDPWLAEAAVLREAFGVDATEGPSGGATVPHGPESDGRTDECADAWRRALAQAVRSAADLAELRRADTGGPGAAGIGTRRRLAALIEAYPTADTSVRPLLVDWMCELQPLGAPSWTIGETARAGSAPPHTRTVRDDLDQPRSTALRERLLALLDAPEPDRRDAAARGLVDWPEPGIRRALLDAYLRGRLALPFGIHLADALADVLATDPRAWCTDEVRPARVLHVAAHLAPEALLPLAPLLLEWWEHGPATLRPGTVNLLRRIPADLLAERLRDRVASGDRGRLELLKGRPLLRTPWLTRGLARLRAQGHADLADDLVLVDGPLRSPGAASDDAALVRVLRERRPPEAAEGRGGPTRAELFALARTGDPEKVRRALRRLVEEHPGRGPDTGPGSAPDPALVDLLTDLLAHPRPKVRLHAHRTSRALLDRDTHLRLTALLLDDPQPDVVRMAVRTLCRARWSAALPAVVGLLTHSHSVVRAAASEGLADVGAAAVPALRYAADHARPDRRGAFTAVLDRIESADD
jgi:HEAT repeat protein